jgi:zinc and cadmium transporter
VTALFWIVIGGLLMSAIALIGGVTLLLTEARLRALLLPLVALAAGTLLGGAFLHLIPAAVSQMGNGLPVYLWILVGFAVFFALEQFLNWHHCHRTSCEHKPLTYLILVADALHNFIGGLAVAGAFLIDIRLGVSAWIAAAAHEVPQELGDFAVLIHGGWKSSRALAFNFLSALTFLAGGLVAYGSSRSYDVEFLLPFAAGNFIYIAAADLIPEVKHQTRLSRSILHSVAFTAGVGLLLIVRLAFESET